MGVFDPRQGQVLPSPVTNFYKGKAIRADLKAAEIDLETKKKQLEMADEKLDLEKRRVAADEQQVENQQEANRLRREEYAERVGLQKAKKQANELIGVTAGARAILREKGPESEPEALAFAEQRIREYAEGLDEEDKKKTLQMLDDKDGLTMPELEAIESEALAAKDQYKQYKTDSLTPTARMIEGLSMGLKPGTKEWNDWISKNGEDGKTFEVDRRLKLAGDILNRRGEFADISDREQAAYLDAIGAQTGPKGSITIDWETADTLAESVIDDTGIGENWVGNNNDSFQEVLAFSIQRLAKDGRFGGEELKRRALVDALGGNWDELIALQEEMAKEGRTVTMDELIFALAEENE